MFRLSAYVHNVMMVEIDVINRIFLKHEVASKKMNGMSLNYVSFLIRFIFLEIRNLELAIKEYIEMEAADLQVDTGWRAASMSEQQFNGY